MYNKIDEFNLKINKERTLISIIVVISLIVIDSTLVKYIAFSNKEYSSLVYVSIFITLTVTFMMTVSVLFLSVKNKSAESNSRRGLSRKGYYIIITVAEIVLISIMITVIQPTIALKSYTTFTLLAAVYIAHITALFFLIILVLTFVNWIMIKRDKILTLYTISFSLTAIAIMVSLIYATYVLSHQPSNIRPSSFHRSLLDLPRGELTMYFGPALDAVSIVAFISVWIASVLLMNTYSKRIGKIRYWLFTSIPLVYFLFPFEKNVVDIFQSLADSFPVFYGVLNVTIFSATKQLGALFFSLSFLFASTLVTRNEMQKYLLISAIGMAILYGSIEIDTLLFATYPPFGLVTVSFMPVGSFLLLIGVVHSARLVAHDKDLRSEFYKTAMSQLNLLKLIGVTEMEKELIRSYKSVGKLHRLPEMESMRLEKDSVRDALHEVVDELDKDNVRELLHEVLTEIYSKSTPKNKD